MQLWYARTSPFARKVRVVACELGLHDRIELIEVDPWTDSRLRELNPLAKVPTLVLDDGSVLLESAVICDYLDALNLPQRLHPSSGPARWQALLSQGLADGALSAAGRLYADEHRSAHERSSAMMERFQHAIDASLDAFDTRWLPDGCDLTIGHVAMAVLMGYLDFRWPQRNWRANRPALAAWFDVFDQRPSMIATRHSG